MTTPTTNPTPQDKGGEGDEGTLLPCPFCGAPAEILDIEEGENAGGSCVACTKCQASSNVDFEFKENFVSNWNRRTLTEETARLFRIHRPRCDCAYRSHEESSMTTYRLVPVERKELGKLIYLSMYGHQGAIWDANETKDVWYQAADRFNELASATQNREAGIIP